MRKQHLSIIIVLIVFVALSSCNKKEGKISDSVPSGFSCASVTGGTAQTDVNMKNVDFVLNGDSFDITIDFALGSDLTGSGEAEVDALPKYEISKLASPYAIAISVDGVAYTEYERSIDFSSIPAIEGSFFDIVSSTLYVRVAYDFAFNVSEGNDSLVVSAVKLNEQHDVDDYAYYVTSNTYEYYCDGLIGFDDMTPTIARNGRIVFISEALSSKEDALSMLEKFQKSYASFAGSFEVIAMYYNEMPIYNNTLDFSAARSAKVIRVESAVKATECLIPDGYCFASTDEGLVYEKPNTNGDNTYSELYIQMKNGSKRLVNFEFANIESVKYSPDGRKFAVLENSATGSHLYVFDSVSHELLYDLSDVGFGKRISEYVWNELGTAIYAISGTDSIAVNMYDFSITDETKRTSTMYKGSVDEGSFELYEGKLYFVDTDESGSTIYSFKPELDTKEIFCEGSAFAFSGEYVAVTTVSTVSSMQEGEYSFFVMDMETGEKTVVTNDFGVFDFKWSQDKQYLYYIENRMSGDDTDTSDSASVAQTDEFPYTLYRFDVKSSKSEVMCDIRVYNRLDVLGSNALITYFESSGDKSYITATYRID